MNAKSIPTHLVLSSLLFPLLPSPASAQAAAPDDPRRTPIVDVIERTKPAVVSIYANIQNDNAWWARSTGVSGTGSVIYEDGYVVTNNHVIANGLRVASDIQIQFDEIDGGKRYSGRVISRVPDQDLALIKIDADGPFPTLDMSDSEPLLGRP